MAELIGIGEAMVEIYADQSLSHATSLRKSYGGDVLNALVTAQRLGTPTAFHSRVGNDPFGLGLLEFCQSEGVDTSQMKLVSGENGVYFISLQADGEREFTYRRRDSAASRYSPDDLEIASLQRSRVLLLSGISQAISASAEQAVLEAARIARASGVRVVFDPNYRAALWVERGGLAAAQSAYQQLEPLVDALLPSFPADFAVLGLGSAQPNGGSAQPLDPSDLATLIGILRQRVALIAVKCGSQGAWIASATLPAQRVAAQSDAQVMDTTGAGDAWNGAFIHGLLTDFTPAMAAALANRVAAAKLGYRGAIPPREAVERAAQRKEQHET